jgi:8-oxo-dGTP pyrophosphatase MutT (NUDIX family)
MGKTNSHRNIAGKVYDGCARLVFRVGYRTLTLLRRVRKSRSMGVGVVIRHRDRVLAVRHSYRPGYDIPGGGVGRREQPRDTAVRELAEELSLRIDRDALVYKRRHHRSHLFELTLDQEPDIQIDNREVIEAVFLSPEEAVIRNPSFRQFI